MKSSCATIGIQGTLAALESEAKCVPGSLQVRPGWLVHFRGDRPPHRWFSNYIRSSPAQRGCPGRGSTGHSDMPGCGRFQAAGLKMAGLDPGPEG